MVIVYLEIKEYTSKVKVALYKFIGAEISMELDHTWACVFYDEVCNTDIGKNKEYEAQCLDIWDLMFENRIGITRDLTEKLTEM